MAAEIHVGDIGTAFKATILNEADEVVDVSTVTTKQLIFRKPDGTLLTKTATFDTDGTDGVIKYTSASGDLDVKGQWKMQGYVVFPGGSWKTSIHDFEVVCNLS